MVGEGIEAKLVRLPSEISALRVAVRRFEFERGVKAGGVGVGKRDAMMVRWLVLLAGLELEVEEQQVREGCMVIRAAG